MKIKYIKFDKLNACKDRFIELYKDVYLNSYNISMTAEFESFIRDKALATIEKNHDNHLFAAFIDNNLVGYLIIDEVVFFSKCIRKINQIVVHKNHRDKGIGQSLINEFIKKAEADFIDEIQLTVTSDNIGAVKLYEKNGFQTFRYVMKKELGGIRNE